VLYPSHQTDDGDFENVDGMFLDYSKIQQVTENKYNLTPRKTFCGADLGSDYGTLRSTYDAYEMQNYEETFLRTNDGKTTLPNRE